MQQLEQVEWDVVNKLLQHHGFKPVFFADPVENKNLTDLVLLDKKSAGELRTTLRTMLMDSERRQALIQELVMSNNHLKEEVQKHTSRAAQQSQRATELEGLLDQVKTRVQDLEDRCLCKAVQQHSLSQQLQLEYRETQKRCRLLEQQLSKQKEEAAQLQRKLYFTVKEEEQRLARQSQTFQRICKKAYKQSSAADQQVLDVIDFYETKVTLLLEELRSAKGEFEGSKTTKTSTVATPPLKTILKEYQDQQKKSDFQIKELKKEIDCLRQELDTRLPKEDNPSESNDVTDHFRDTRVCLHYQHLLTEISALVANPNAPLRLRSKRSMNGLELPDYRALLPTLEEWAQQLQLLKELQRSINKLSVRLMPGQPSDVNSAEAVKVENMMLLVDTLLENVSADDQQKLRSPTRYTLESMVSHFQKLFDVSSISGVYPCMNKVYTRLGEMTNAMRNLREILGLDSRVSSVEVVNQVARLVSSKDDRGGFHHLLGDADINSIIIKVRQHDEFFPAFHALVTDMLEILGVNRLSDILPALKSLTRTSH
ncbi:centrosomal protein of 70 kDa [Nematolebias whitei]|uniref:centrosomal protein of 70 kDa n=1 Tax=Nematolebias whitei TaxID=451745 RepID=UPI001897838A|nr:centrosomal protein of 70 kDa [Nematolebias whitei]